MKMSEDKFEPIESEADYLAWQAAFRKRCEEADERIAAFKKQSFGEYKIQLMKDWDAGRIPKPEDDSSQKSL